MGGEGVSQKGVGGFRFLIELSQSGVKRGRGEVQEGRCRKIFFSSLLREGVLFRLEREEKTRNSLLTF